MAGVFLPWIPEPFVPCPFFLLESAAFRTAFSSLVLQQNLHWRIILSWAPLIPYSFSFRGGLWKGSSEHGRNHLAYDTGAA